MGHIDVAGWTYLRGLEILGREVDEKSLMSLCHLGIGHSVLAVHPLFRKQTKETVK